eukprot:TRINITY_DN9288_c0_g1_i1.p1 TRINITY_DN9288_c0_g1~~TRINITY_DN9288_c0_g1_i1.p1  ORF type:complete len:414 (-),score=56.98 TRINITY_DN9288_c0_g1_i1:119-1360(-)
MNNHQSTIIQQPTIIIQQSNTLQQQQQQQQQQQLLYQQQLYTQQIYQQQLQKVYEQQMQNQIQSKSPIQTQQQQQIMPQQQQIMLQQQQQIVPQQQQQMIPSSPFQPLYAAQSGSYGGVPQQQVVTTGDKQFMNLSSTGDNSNSFAGTLSSDLPCFPVEDLWIDDEDDDDNNEVVQGQGLERKKDGGKQDLGIKQDGKAKKRRIRSKEQQVQNKIAQQRYRERRKLKYSEMEGTVDELSGTLKLVEEKVTELQNENQNLNNLVQNYEGEIVELRNQLRNLTVTSRMNMDTNMQIQSGGNESHEKWIEEQNLSMSSIRSIMDKHHLLAAENEDNLDALNHADISGEDVEQLGKQLSRYISSSMKLHSDDICMPNRGSLVRHPNLQSDDIQPSCSSYKVYVPVPFKQYADQEKQI